MPQGQWRRPSALLCATVVVVFATARMRVGPPSSPFVFGLRVWSASPSPPTRSLLLRRRMRDHHYYRGEYADCQSHHRQIGRMQMSPDNNDDDEDTILNSVTDAEALLACRAYLQRTNRLQEWTAAAERQGWRTRAEHQARQSDAYGFFWNDPDELVYYNRRQQAQPATRRSAPKDKKNNQHHAVSHPDVVVDLPAYGSFRAMEDIISKHAEDALTTIQDDSIAETQKAPTGDAIWEAPTSSSNYPHGIVESTDGTMAKEDPIVYSASLTAATAESLVPPFPSSSSVDQFEDTAEWENAHILPEEYYTSSSPYFKLDDETPSRSHTRRSQAAQRRFQDPDWKARWYERRWGGRHSKREPSLNNNNTTMTRRQWKSLEERLRSPRMRGFLSHPALAALSEVEMAHAIRTYVVANRQRSAAATVRRQQRRAAWTMVPASDNDKNKLPRDAIWQKFNAETILQAQRQQRAERARKAYATRLANNNNNNQNNGSTDQSRKRSSLLAAPPRLDNDETSPRAALERVEWRLDNNDNVNCNLDGRDDDDDDDEAHHPSTEAAVAATVSWWCALEYDLQCLLEPGKLTRRKPVLRRVLSDWFDKRGQCVPVFRHETFQPDDDHQYQFVTQCAVAELGAFVLQLVQQRRRELEVMALENNNNNNNNNNKHHGVKKS